MSGGARSFFAKSVSFLAAAKIVHGSGSKDKLEDVSFYLLSHAFELGVKAIAAATLPSEKIEYTHDKRDLATKYWEVCSFSHQDIEVASKLRDLNNGSGGLRYPNQVVGAFDPNLFDDGAALIEQLHLKLTADT